jgi:CheY-like chemotaxis protein
MAIVLVVNDDRTMLDLYEAVLTDLGHEPVTKMTVSSGPETVRDVGADALVVDLERPDEEAYGLRIIEELRCDPALGELPVILCTAAAQEVRPLLERLDGLGVAVVEKPFDVAELEQALRDALGDAQERRSSGGLATPPRS